MNVHTDPLKMYLDTATLVAKIKADAPNTKPFALLNQRAHSVVWHAERDRLVELGMKACERKRLADIDCAVEINIWRNDVIAQGYTL